ncbi:MAG: hypothetical protein ABSG43_24600 [Solirubrobacteraceae bacterium]|jgi:hypothetical protein
MSAIFMVIFAGMFVLPALLVLAPALYGAGYGLRVVGRRLAADNGRGAVVRSAGGGSLCADLSDAL